MESGGMTDLMKYRLSRAEESLLVARENLTNGHYRESMNRSYYAVFYAICAANNLYGFDSKKHSGVIAFFNRTFLKENVLDRDLSDVIQKTSYFRERADYQDFFYTTQSEAEKQLAIAKRFVETVSAFLANKLMPDA